MKTRNTAVLAACAVGALAVLPASASAALLPITTLTLENTTVDSHSGTPVQTSLPLLPVVSYTVKVTGTYSAFSASLYNQPAGSYWKTCGTPLSTPAGPTGADSEFLFAAPLPYFSCGNFKPPTPLGKFQIDTGSGFQDPTPIGGAPTAPSADHTYTYRVYSSGLLAPAKFRILDSSYGDNYGTLKVTISLDVI